MTPLRFLIIALALCLSPLYAAENPVQLDLLDGSKIKGRVMSVTASEVTIMADFGVLRIELAKLTPASRSAVAPEINTDPQVLLQRISELEARVRQLTQENEQLRRLASSGTGTSSGGYNRQGVQSITPTTRSSGSTSTSSSSTSSSRSYSVSSTGKRHNSSCRYFGSGRSAGPNEGIACKICGG